MERQPAVAGQFYARGGDQLRRELAALIPATPEQKHTVRGVIAPHAGYMYSGAIAGAVYATVEIPSTVLIIGPNHRGNGAGAALFPDGNWLTPLGMVPINSRLNDLLLKHVPYISSDFVAHEFEHSLEVHVPFLQTLRPDVSISALCLGHGDYTAVKDLGNGIAAALRAFGEPVLIIASSDMTHYESAESARSKDWIALQRVLDLDPEGLLQICRRERITMCGVVPSAVMLVAAITLGATHAETVAYGTSGDVTGDNREVVGYAAVSVW